MVARTRLELKALAADRFTAVVLGYAPSAQAAATTVEDQLERYAPDDLPDGPQTS